MIDSKNQLKTVNSFACGLDIDTTSPPSISAFLSPERTYPFLQLEQSSNSIDKLDIPLSRNEEGISPLFLLNNTTSGENSLRLEILPGRDSPAAPHLNAPVDAPEVPWLKKGGEKLSPARFFVQYFGSTVIGDIAKRHLQK